MLPKSIRWRLPLSYAMIGLLATLALGGVLITSLREYYAQRERDTLVSNAQLISDYVSRMYERQRPQSFIDAQINTLSFVSQTRIQLFDSGHTLLLDSGNPGQKRVVTMNYDGTPPDGTTSSSSAIFFGTTQRTSPVPDAGLSNLTMLPDHFWIRSGTAGSQLEGPPPPDQFAFAVASSPYGVGLRREFGPISLSDQSVTVTVRGDQSKTIGSIEVSNGPAYGTEIIQGMTWALMRAGLIAALLAGGVGWFVSWNITTPLLALSKATSKMADGELSTRVNIRRADEFGVLARSFNDMALRVDTTVSALRRFVADAAHQIHTPITAVHADLELAGSEPDPERQRMFINRAMAQLKRLEVLTNDLLDLSRLEAHAVDDRRAAVDLVQLVREISETFASRAEQAGIAFNLDTPEPSVKAKVNETQFRHAIGNLLDNAIKFTPENGTITVGVRRDGDQVEISVNDTGIGIATEDLGALFNRFHRGRNAAAYPGSGLGLAIIKAIVDGHNGEIRVQSSDGDGTRFALRVPVGVS